MYKVSDVKFPSNGETLAGKLFMPAGNGPFVADLVFLVDYLFKNGDAPSVLEAADVDGTPGITVPDLVFMVDYLFKSGPPPTCGEEN